MVLLSMTSNSGCVGMYPWCWRSLGCSWKDFDQFGGGGGGLWFVWIAPVLLTVNPLGSASRSVTSTSTKHAVLPCRNGSRSFCVPFAEV